MRAVRVLVTAGRTTFPPAWREADLILSWEGARANLSRNFQELLRWQRRELASQMADLLDIASAIYAADIGLPRGRQEQWVRQIHMFLPVRDLAFWQARADALGYLLYVLTRDHYVFEFVAREREEEACLSRAEEAHFAADCVCLLSGGVDSLAGALMLLHTGRKPMFVCHQSGNPTIRAAQHYVLQSLHGLAAGQFGSATLRLQVRGQSGHFPAPAQREPSQRARGFLFMSLALAAAAGLGVSEAYMYENGILTLAVPLSSARIGGLSTRSTHPKIMALMNRLAADMGLGVELLNPFMYQTKAEIIRDILRPRLSPSVIQKTVSCWAAGRASRPCGGCVACLIRRLAMLAAGLPDEAYEIDVLAEPQRYRGTEAYANLVDLLGLSGEYLARPDAELLKLSPELVDCASYGVSLTDALAMYRRFAQEVHSVVQAHFPQAAQLFRA